MCRLSLRRVRSIGMDAKPRVMERVLLLVVDPRSQHSSDRELVTPPDISSLSETAIRVSRHLLS